VAEGRLVRLAVDADGSVVPGPTLAGRGAWLCRGETSCLTSALRRKALAKALRVEIGAEAAAELRQRLDGDFPASSPDARD
jgi:predicted RNA-binding protein YlxR (DUF448 family)